MTHGQQNLVLLRLYCQPTPFLGFLLTLLFSSSKLFQPIIKKKKEGEEKRMTQEEMLLEAAETGLLCFLFTISKNR